VEDVPSSHFFVYALGDVTVSQSAISQHKIVRVVIEVKAKTESLSKHVAQALTYCGIIAQCLHNLRTPVSAENPLVMVAILINAEAFLVLKAVFSTMDFSSVLAASSPVNFYAEYGPRILVRSNSLDIDGISELSCFLSIPSVEVMDLIIQHLQ